MDVAKVLTLCATTAAVSAVAVSAFCQIELDGGTRRPASTQKTYVFTCGGERYSVGLTMTPEGGVTLDRFDNPWGKLRPEDRRGVEATLGRFSVIDNVTLRCGDHRTDQIMLSGLSRSPKAGDGGDRRLAILMYFDQSRLVRTTE